MHQFLSLPFASRMSRLATTAMVTVVASVGGFTTSTAGAAPQQPPPQAAPTTQTQPPAQTQAVQTNPAKPNSPAGNEAGQPITITGCLQPAQDGKTGFQLIVADARQSTTNARAVTTAYALTAEPQVDLQSHLRELVELTGSELPVPAQSASVTDHTRSTSEPATVGTSGRPGAGTGTGAAKTTPTVETKTNATIVAKAMTVRGVKTVATKCQ